MPHMKTEGVICVLKPPGMSSSDAVTDVRRVFGEKRVGHTGTLDPAAAGVLPICIGRATRLFDFLVDKRKEYIAELVIGVATDTEDATGSIIACSDKTVTEEELSTALSGFVGEIEQTPPIYSALNLNGVKLYKLARAGEISESLENKKRRISIFELELIRQVEKNRFLIRIVCSKGTYIRTLCKDIGAALGCPAYMGFLLRTKSGAFTLEESYSIAELNQMRDEGTLKDAVIPMDRAIAHVPEIRVSGLSFKKEQLLLHGAGIKFMHEVECLPHRIYLNDEFLGLGEVRDGELKVTVWLGPEEYQIKGMKLDGVVGANRHIGTSMGFPTANLEGYDKRQMPKEGVYATAVVLDGKRYMGVTSIGSNPTVNGSGVTVETHLLDYSGDCYGKPMTVIFVERLRGMIKFPSLDALSKQISTDIDAARSILEKSKYIE